MICKTTFTPLLLVAAPVVGMSYTASNPDATLAALRSVEAPALSTLRAGAPVTHTLGGETRDELRRADQNSTSLANLRAGALSDREWMIVGLTALAIVLLIIIL